MNPIIQADNLSRFYGIILGLNNVTFTIRPGITGIVGPNGAGKTTLFRLLLGQIQPSSGSLTVFGERPWNNPAVQTLAGVTGIAAMVALAAVLARNERISTWHSRSI